MVTTITATMQTRLMTLPNPVGNFWSAFARPAHCLRIQTLVYGIGHRVHGGCKHRTAAANGRRIPLIMANPVLPSAAMADEVFPFLMSRHVFFNPNLRHNVDFDLN